MTDFVYFRHGIDYPDAEDLTLTEIAETLIAHEVAIPASITVIEKLLPGIRVEKTTITLTELRIGSLAEAFFVGILVVYQKELGEEVPEIVENLLGVQLSDEYDTLVTVVFMGILFYSMKALYAGIKHLATPQPIEKQYRRYVDHLSKTLGIPAEQIDAAMADVVQGARKPRLVQAAARLFRPAKKGRDGRMVPLNLDPLPHEVVEAVPALAVIAEMKDDASVPDPHPNTILEIRATDLDRGTGWAGRLHVPGGVTKRLPLSLYPTVDRQRLSETRRARVDAVLECRLDGHEMTPKRIHVLGVKSYGGE